MSGGDAVTAPRATAGVITPSVHAYVDAFRKGDVSGDSGLVHDARLDGIEYLEAVGFPTMRDEDWHFTSVTPIAEREFTIGARPGSVSAEQIAPFTMGQRDWHTLVFVDGVYSERLSTFGDLPAGATVQSLSAAIDDESSPVHNWFGTVARPEYNAFNALNAAFSSEGALIVVEEEVTIHEPIHLIYVTTDAAQGAMLLPRTVVLMRPYSRAVIVESYVSLSGATYFTNAVTEMYLDDGAQVDHFKVQRESTKAFHVGTIQVFQDGNSTFNSFSFATGAALSRTNVYTSLNGPGAGAILNGLYMVGGEQHVDHQTRIEHLAPHCTSWEVYKGILDGSAHGVFNGKVYVHPDAQKTDGKQSNNNLLLSERARIDTKPQLEIFADDVKCTHGATVGRLDPQAMFYCESRGIGTEKARTLLTYAFAASVLDEIPLAPLRESLEAMVMTQVSDR